jgi:hypothetical protein
VYIQEEPVEKERSVPPDYSGHTYVTEPVLSDKGEEREQEDAHSEPLREQKEKSTPVGAFGRGGEENKRAESHGAWGLGGLFSRIPFLSSLAPPARRCEGETRGHSELWDLVLLAVIALALLKGKDDDVLPLLLLLLLWD